MIANERADAIRPILVPLDGSELAERALFYVGLIPSRAVRLLASAPIELSAARHRWAMGEISPDGGSWLVSTPADYLNLVGFPLRAQGREVEVVVAVGATGPCIVGASVDAGLVVLTTRGYGLTQRLIGSTSAHVVRHVGVPTVLIRDERPVASPAVRIVVPLDGSDDAAEALVLAEVFRHSFGAALHLVRVVSVGGWGDDTKELERDAAIYLERQREKLGNSARYVTFEVLDATSGKIAEAIQSVLRPGDMVVLATQGRGGMGRRLLGSVSTAIVEGAKVPVVLVRAAPGETKESLSLLRGAESILGDRVPNW